MMDDNPVDIDLDTSAPQEPGDFSRQRNKPLVIGVAVALGLALVLGYLYLRAPSRQPTRAATTPSAQPNAAPGTGAEPGEQISLPPLDQTDALIRQLVGQLSSHPMVAAWLTTDGLIVNFAVVTQRIADGASPRRELAPIGPVPPFRPRTSRGDLFVDPASYRRYDRYAQAVASLDARGTARLYTTVKPRIVDAYERMERPTNDFDPVLERAIVELLSVPIVQGDIELVPKGIVYGYADPALEGLSAAQKNLLRMGPQNIQIVQAKLREIADYLGIPEAKLPRPRTLTLNE